MIRGLDISAAQGTINYDLVPPEFEFFIVKVSEGEIYKDSTRVRNMAEARRTKRQVMAYHFLKTLQDPTKQAENFWNAIGEQLPIFSWLDFEVIADGLSTADACKKAVDTLLAIESYGIRCGVYVYPDHAKRVIVPNAKGVAAPLGLRPLWMADYRKGESPSEGSSPYIAAPWTNWTLWQTSGNNSSKVPGIFGAVDHNVFNGDKEDFIKWLDLGKGEEEAPVIHAGLDFEERKYDLEKK